jgi:hypothetical protein
MVDLIRHLSSDLVERHAIEVDSEETVDFSARKSCVNIVWESRTTPAALGIYGSFFATIAKRLG